MIPMKTHKTRYLLPLSLSIPLPGPGPELVCLHWIASACCQFSTYCHETRHHRSHLLQLRINIVWRILEFDTLWRESYPLAQL